MRTAAALRGTSTVRTALLLLIVSAGVLALCGGLYLREVGAAEQRQREREANRVALYTHYFRMELRPVIQDLRTLATGDGLVAWIETGRNADFERAAQRAAFYSRLHPAYDKVRFLDERGRERIRVNRNGTIVPAAQLQDLSGYGFYQQAAGLPAGEIAISPFDLNVENGEVERPLKPTLRFSIPVFDADGRRRGVYVINYLGSELLARLEEMVPSFAHRLRMLNPSGYWLKAGTPAEEWGFLLPGRSDHTLARSNPVLWNRLGREEKGQAMDAGGLFTWERVSPRAIETSSAGAVVAGDEHIIFATEVSADEWAALFTNMRQIFLIVTPVLLVLAGGGTWLLLARRRTLDELRRSEESLAITLHSIGDAVLATDTAGRVTLLNPVAEQLTGWTLAEARGRPVREVFNVVHEETRAAAPIPVDAVLATGEIQGLANHTVIVARDGREYAIADSAAPIRDRAKRILGVVLVFRDVTASRRAQAELDRFFQLSLDFLCISAPDGYFKRVSPGVTAILGWPVDEFLATPYLDLVHPDDLSATVAEVERQMQDGKAVLNFENRYRHQDGSWRVLSWRSVPDPRSGLMYATARDVTERKRIDDHVRELNDELQQRAAQLEVANKELESFSYSVSHDLRAPLRHIQGYVEMLTRDLDQNLSEKSRRFLKTISDAGQEMGVLIDDLLAFSRMGRSEMIQQEIDLTPLVADVRRGLEIAWRGDRNINWHVGALPRVQGDAAMVRQVLFNLLGNAIKYTRGRDPAEIAIGVLAAQEEGRVVFYIRDNGAGFDMKYADKLFGVFQRLHRADEFEGSGIGLASVRRIIARHGGRTWAEGRLNAGATFYFTLKPATPLSS